MSFIDGFRSCIMVFEQIYGGMHMYRDDGREQMVVAPASLHAYVVLLLIQTRDVTR